MVSGHWCSHRRRRRPTVGVREVETYICQCTSGIKLKFTIHESFALTPSQMQ
jgi:hypothetical protein